MAEKPRNGAEELGNLRPSGDLSDFARFPRLPPWAKVYRSSERIKRRCATEEVRPAAPDLRPLSFHHAAR